MNKKELLKNKFFSLARLESLKTDFRARVGAVIVKNKRVVALGHNRPNKSHPMVRKYDPFKGICAEVDTIVGHDRDALQNGTIFVYRETRNGELAVAKPCLSCQQILADMQIKRVYYTTSYGFDVLHLKK